MKKLSFTIRVISIALVIAVFTNSIGYSITPTIVHAQSNCGEWIVENLGSSDQRIDIKLVEKATGSDCHGMFTLYNQTGPVIKTGTKLGDISLGGYSFDLWPSSNNANYQLTSHNYPVLIPGLPLDITTTPIDIRITGIVSIQSEVTVKSASVDASLFLLKSIIDAADVPCVLSYDQFSLIATRTASVIDNAVKLAFEGKVIESIREFSRVKDAFLEKAADASKEIGVSCLAELLLNKSSYLVKIGFSYTSWVGTTLIDYFKYNGTGGPLIVLSYIPPVPPTPTLVPTAISSPTSILNTPETVMESTPEIGTECIPEMVTDYKGFLLTPDAYNIIDFGDGGILFHTNCSLESTIKFYRDQYTLRGYTERKEMTVNSNSIFSLVFDGDPSGKAIVVQSVALVNGSRSVAIRFDNL